jgi:TPR repeat protein
MALVVPLLAAWTPKAVCPSAAKCEKACTKKKDATACLRGGWIYLTGIKGTEQDRDKARELLTRACDLDEPRACDLLIARYNRDLFEKTEALYQARCAKDDAEACEQWGDYLEDDKRAAMAAKRRACELGADDACVWVVNEIYYGSGDTDAAEGDAFLEAACKRKLPATCTRLADEIATSEKARAQKLYAAACAQGHVRACLDLGTKAGQARAVKLWSARCDDGDHDACFELADRYERGSGLPRSAEKAATYHARYCHYWPEARRCKK